ncbi:MAG: hypothetical protein ABJG45_31600, partial [Rhodopirellula bahusiensis]
MIARSGDPAAELQSWCQSEQPGFSPINGSEVSDLSHHCPPLSQIWNVNCSLMGTSIFKTNHITSSGVPMSNRMKFNDQLTVGPQPNQEELKSFPD